MLWIDSNDTNMVSFAVESHQEYEAALRCWVMREGFNIGLVRKRWKGVGEFWGRRENRGRAWWFEGSSGHLYDGAHRCSGATCESQALKQGDVVCALAASQDGSHHQCDVDVEAFGAFSPGSRL